jgi:hypothetical protein
VGVHGEKEGTAIYRGSVKRKCSALRPTDSRLHSFLVTILDTIESS